MGKEDEYEDYLGRHGGASNAYTDTEDTELVMGSVSASLFLDEHIEDKNTDNLKDMDDMEDMEDVEDVEHKEDREDMEDTKDKADTEDTELVEDKKEVI